MIELEDKYTLSAELPGLQKEDIKIMVQDDGTLDISGEKKNSFEEMTASVGRVCFLFVQWFVCFCYNLLLSFHQLKSTTYT